jgi:chromatin segregation and condensation protein Rec8/ScpA/Scc1 (kleisin family)
VGELSRVEQAVAFLALLDLRRGGEISIEQAAPFAPIRVSQIRATRKESESEDERTPAWTLHSA